MRLHLTGLISLCLALPIAQAGEIIIGNPPPAQTTSEIPVAPLPSEQTGSSASDLRKEARSYLDEDNEEEQVSPPTITKSTAPQTNAAKMRQTARSWNPPASSVKETRDGRCRTENTSGSIEGTIQGHTVIQNTTSGVNNICK